MSSCESGRPQVQSHQPVEDLGRDARTKLGVGFQDPGKKGEKVSDTVSGVLSWRLHLSSPQFLAGIHLFSPWREGWIPAPGEKRAGEGSAGMTEKRKDGRAPAGMRGRKPR